MWFVLAVIIYTVSVTYCQHDIFCNLFNILVCNDSNVLICCTGDTLLVGTRQGHLLVYSVRPSHGLPDRPFDTALERSNKSFAKKPITQLEVVPEYHIVVSISGICCQHCMLLLFILHNAEQSFLLHFIMVAEVTTAVVKMYRYISIYLNCSTLVQMLVE